ncbi:LOG family protein YJL055W [Saccharomyces cerevisiae S288c] [Rhizoctonia solani]|uniref:LOG family protein YJL055W [Saccharomyces cerevisiae S288c] n=1 Tax=Rhizoctonia solani TaxID=456999 RepID=A0A0K6G9G9_9AGAM|nr:LOG family protein YJL055W [Saccharomyces cerevisiae S288c] [Rhizoctonia solani]
MLPRAKDEITQVVASNVLVVLMYRRDPRKKWILTLTVPYPAPSLTYNNSLFKPEMSEITVSPNAACVYCGSSPGTSAEYMQVAEAVGIALAQAEIGLVYGGGRRGLMAGAAFACARAGGKVTGVLPQAIKASGGEGIGPILASNNNEDEAVWARMESIVVQSMHERKRTMAMRSGGFIGLPGGYGTFEEVLEVITWNQLGIHLKPVVIINVRGYYEPLKLLIENGVREGFIKPANASLVTILDPPANGDWGQAVIQALRTWKPDDGAGYKLNWGQTQPSKDSMDAI